MNPPDESDIPDVSAPPVTEEEPGPLNDTALQHEGYETLAHGFLSPRHRRLAQLAAEGKSNAMIAEELGYVGSRVSVLLKHPAIAAEIRRLQERIFEETIAQRLKSFAEPALQNISMILTDRTNRVKVSEKADMSKWIVEKLDGKATQKTDIGENLLSVLMDRLDARGQVPQQRAVTETHRSSADIEITANPALPPPPKTEEDALAEWAADFCSTSD